LEASMIEAVLDRTPVEAHVEVSEWCEHPDLAVTKMGQDDVDTDKPM
jgi:hypothetical protein